MREDMALAGFDDVPVVRESAPPLTTEALPLTETGEQVIALASRAVGCGALPGTRIEGDVVLRGSIGAPPGR
ncbi:substrate-binding domain-containing protein [Streptomyces sp. WZ.A104]|uniref:substrate-binding domain-containing protein n=1 Tax=Streptomyces sp. WZ.A104 TaxID=2023771 RepID=UPI00211C3C03|nr:substrate-binding domain-containing protein [Streptomyces sp. WZ.A104]